MPLLNSSSSPVAVIQQISVGGTADGTAPGGTADLSKSARIIYPAAATGGLFDFVETSKCITVVSMELVLGGQTSWTAAVTDGVTDATANDVVFAQGTNETSAISSQALNLFLLPGQKVRITTTGVAANAWRLTVKYISTTNEFGLFI